MAKTRRKSAPAKPSKKPPKPSPARLEEARAALARLFPPVPPGKPPDESQFLAESRPDTRSGKAARTPKSRFSDAEPSQVMTEAREPIQIPKFLRALVQKKASDDVLLRETYERVKRLTTRQGLRLLQAVILDLSRRPNPRIKFHDVITSKYVRPLLAKR
jgi:hypothetical protein